MKVYNMKDIYTLNVEEGEFLLDTKKKIEIYDVIKHQGKYYAVCQLSEVKEDGKRVAGVRPIDYKEKPEPIEYSSEFKCPYCGNVDNDAWELDDDGETECGSCGATIEYERVVTVEYNISPVKKPNVVKV